MPKKVLIDTDPGGDDIYSLFWLQSLMRREVIELLAIATTEGNVSARNTFNAACQVLRLADIDTVAVGRGVDVPQKYFTDASHIHGADGMGNLSRSLPPGRRRFHESLVSDDLIIRVLKAHPYEVTLVAIAPLSNLAAAEVKEPGILRLAKEVVIMGGAFDAPGNITPVAEFNMAFNPKAAQRVLASREDLVILPLDITRELVFTPEMLRQVTGLEPPNPLAQFIADLAQFLMTTALQYRETGGKRGFLVHDAVAVAYLVYPELFKFSRALVSIETEGRLTAGQTMRDRRHGFKTGVNAWVAEQVDATHLLACLVEDLHYLVANTAAYA
ncbi:MAG: nucleoside hydrolase [Cyanobacteria bacterium P01_G01_bin.54]